MTNFEITADSVTGGSDDSQNESFIARVKNLEGFATAIGKSLGMTTVDRGFVSTDRESYGFRFAVTSEEKFDAKGIVVPENLSPSQLIDKLG